MNHIDLVDITMINRMRRIDRMRQQALNDWEAIFLLHHSQWQSYARSVLTETV